MNYFGIDVSKDKLDVFVNGQSGQFENNATGFKALISWLRKKKCLTNLHVCLESTGHYGYPVAEYLHAKGIKVSIVNPALIKSFANSLGKRNKTDSIDAEVIARFCEVNQPSVWEPPSKEVKELIEITRAIDDIKRQRDALNNRLEANLTEAVRKALKKIVSQLDEQISILEKEAARTVSDDDDLSAKKNLLLSIPGIGEQTAHIILAETKGKPENFDSSRKLVAYVGLSPSKRQSGKSLNWTVLSKKGSSYFRSKLYFPCLSAIRSNEKIKQFYDRLLQNGKTKMQAVCACMAKLLKIAYGVLKSGKPFESNYQNFSFSS